MIDDGARLWFDNLCGCGNVEEDKDMIDDGRPVRRPIRIGGSILLYGKRKSSFPFHCMVGPDYPFVIVTYLLVVGVHAIVLGLSAPVLGWPPVLVGLVGFIGIIVSYTIVAFSDPGIVYRSDYEMTSTASNVDVEDPHAALTAHAEHRPMQNSGDDQNMSAPPKVGTVLSVSPPGQSGTINTGDNTATASVGTGTSTSTGAGVGNTNPSNVARSGSTVMSTVPSETMECGICHFQRPYSARHCAYCENCIDKLDHHCPWSGKCIGRNNIKAFWVFTSLICFQTYYLIGVFIYFLIVVAANDENIPTGPHFN